MKFGLSFAIFALTGALFPAFSQSDPANPHKVVVTSNLPRPTRIVQATPRPTPAPVIANDEPGGPSVPASDNGRPTANLSFGELKSRIAEAKRQLQSRPQLIASEDPKLQTNWVRIAFLDPQTQQTDFVTLSKDIFLKTGALNQGFASGGRQIMVRTIRANGVNTPVQMFDNRGQMQLPLMVQYPVEKGGRYVETAYYMSTHPGLVTPEVVNAGRLYVRNVIEIARDRLKQKGIQVPPKIADIAERLATVEHVDHDRFRNEAHQNIYNDIFTLYALNEGQTYRYSVSSAGAGGMVQMIPSTYAMIRRRYSHVGLMPDFVDGMRNHVNATEAMLLYMQMTWSDLASSPTVREAMTSGIATQEQLMAAGYNSNPARLPGYINRGGSGWTSLIPRETRIYLQIYESLERYVPMTPRTR
jgi:hypothetical protein